MGIPWYFYNIYKKYNIENDLIINEDEIQKKNINDLFLDYNSMIHPCAQKTIELYELKFQDNYSYNEEELEKMIIEECLNYTRYIISIIKPNNVYIMIDGVAPRAKINQQRERRYKSYFFKKYILNENRENRENRENENVVTVKKINWDSNKITPGTLFMDKLASSLQKFRIELLENKKKCFYSPKNIIISDSNEPGEGEHKMMKIISTKLNYNINEKICIYGLDADLIMLSLMNKLSDSIILIRDNTFNKKLSEQNRNYMYVDILKLKKYICKDLRSENKNLTIETITDTNLLNDYIFLCFLLGNDFLEHIPSLMIKENGINLLVKSYNLVINTKKYKKLVDLDGIGSVGDGIGSVGDGGNINLHMLRDIFYHLSKSEEYFFKNVYSVYKMKNTNCIYKDVYDLDNSNFQKIYFYKNDILKLNEKGYKKRYYNFYGVEFDESNMEICKDYIIGLHWILGYYTGHIHDNWDWFYNHEAIPFASDIFTYLLTNQLDLVFDFEKTLPNTQLEQLFMVLPRDSLLDIIGKIDKKLLDKSKRIFNTYSEELEKYYPKTIALELINKEYLWQSKIFLQPFNKKILNLFLI
jgi:5'-3' exonuclease